MRRPEEPGWATSVGETLEVHEPLVGELHVEILVEQHDAVAHVVEHGLHHLARRVDVAPRRIGRLLGSGERFLAVSSAR